MAAIWTPGTAFELSRGGMPVGVLARKADAHCAWW